MFSTYRDCLLGLAAALSICAAPAIAADEPFEPVAPDRPVVGVEPAAAHEEPPITESDRRHWSFQPLATIPLPDVERGDWCRTPIDRFILSRLEADGLSPVGEADRTTLIRRVTFDLAGLPPTLDEIDKFLNDSSPDAYERLVDRLLHSRVYAERRAQHWLDLARFAETDGFEHDLVRPSAWKYRDWVISAFARDLPYREFVRAQLAADQLGNGERDALEFLIAGPDMPDINSQDERRHFVMNDMTSTVGSVFIGLQMGCASCHDHKFDPISQHDFYRLRAYFDPLFAFEKNKRTGTQSPVEAKSSSRLMVRGDFRRPGPSVSPAVPRIGLAPVAAPASHPDRVALADWITDPENPLAARVVVNRVWQQHFGYGLSRSESDFGFMGERPEHLELLDWLAREFSRRGGSFRELHRLIVTSATYRSASRLAAPAAEEVRTAWTTLTEADPENRLLGRFPRRRLDGEAIRDAMLSASGTLNPMSGGPGVLPPLPKEIVSTLLKDQWTVTAEVSEHSRRSVYLFVRRNLRYPLFDAFDKPDTNQSCPRRNVSTIAPQALFLLNSPFSVDCAQRLAEQARTTAPDDRAEQIAFCYRNCFGRGPNAAELDAAEDFLASGRADITLTSFCLALFNANEFVYID